MPTFELLTEAAASPKLAHELGLTLEHDSAVLYLSPERSAGRGNVCSAATAECISGCLGPHSGRAAIIKAGEVTNAILQARHRRTQLFFDDTDAFLAKLTRDTGKHHAWCSERGRKAAQRLNGASDVPWERVCPELFAEFSEVQFYDYTKIPPRKRSDLPSNYSLTQSFSGHNFDDCFEALAMGRNVAAVVRVKPSEAMPEFVGDIAPKHPFASLPMIDGDIHDQRFLDPKNVVVGLRAKGKLRKIFNTAFVID